MKKTSLGGRPEWYSRYRRSQSPSFTLRPKHRGQDLSIPQQARECWSRGGPRCDHPPPSDHPDLPPRQCRAGPRIARSPKQELLPAPSSPRTLLLVLQLLLQAHQGRGSISRARSSSRQHQRTKTSGGKGARGSPADEAEPTAPTAGEKERRPRMLVLLSPAMEEAGKERPREMVVVAAERDTRSAGRGRAEGAVRRCRCRRRLPGAAAGSFGGARW